MIQDLGAKLFSDSFPVEKCFKTLFSLSPNVIK